MTTKVPRGNELRTAILEALDLENFTASRIIVDCWGDSPIMVYIEAFASDKILELDWAGELRGAKVKIVDADWQPETDIES